uniref:Uncharacterized protein n=1 Tax=Heterorhabditis bacteriophora TaxID=37862 RepID=A0A1I7X9Y6_HETBA
MGPTLYYSVNRLSSFSQTYIRPMLQRGYRKEIKENKLLEMDRFETMRSAFISIAIRYSSLESHLCYSGDIPREMLEEEEFFIHKKKEDIEKRTEKLTKDISHIRQLMHNPLEEFYANRNLVDEEENERRRMSAIHHMRLLQNKARGMQPGTTRYLYNVFCRKSKRSFFGGRKLSKRNTHQGLILASMGSLGIHTVEAGNSRKDSELTREDEGLTMGSNDQHQLYTIREGSEVQP